MRNQLAICLVQLASAAAVAAAAAAKQQWLG